MTPIDDLPPLRDVIAKHNLSAKKSLGQNFLLDLNLTSKIARASGDLEGANVVEIGPGPGGLTRALLAGGASVLAIERDNRCLPVLQEIWESYPSKLTIIEGDAMDVDPRQYLNGHARIVANLPYNVGTALLVRWLTSDTWPPWWQSLTLLFQREVADRIVAPTGTKAFGRLSVLAQWRCSANRVFDIPPQAFTPAPKVTSSLVQLEPKPAPEVSGRKLQELTAAAFAQRRKMLRQSLKPLGPKVLLWLKNASIDPTRRAETLSIAEFLELARQSEL